jgi:tRNA (cytidine32/uridine32-2'-O)-methyltransferase
MSTLDQVRVVLVEPQFPRNIGSAARAIKSMGLGSLWLVRPAAYPDREASMMAAEAADTLNAARVVATLAEAIDDCTLTIATSKRHRSIDWPTLDVDQTITKVAGASGPVALVFGPEPSGLSNEQLYRCRYRSHLPTSEACTSLNLAQAVQIYGYALRRGLLDQPAPEAGKPPATQASQDAFHEHLMALLTDLDFPRHNPDNLAHRLQALFNRADLSRAEVNLLRGILHRIAERIDTPPDP